MVNVSRQILVSAPRDSVRQYLQDLRNMARYGKKIEIVEVNLAEDQGGLVEVSGRFLGLPWKGEFKAELMRDGGYRLDMVRGPLANISSGFHLRSVQGGTVITHDQQCQFPVLFKLLTPLLRRWLSRSMDKQLYAIKEGAERLHRQIQIQQIEAAG